MTYKEWLIGQSLVRFPKESFYRFGDRNCLPNQISFANYFSPDGIPIDVQAMDISETAGQEDFIEPQDIVDYVYTYVQNPFVRKVKPTYEYEFTDPNDPDNKTNL